MGGAQTLNTLRELDLEVRAVVSSGYSNDPVMARFEEHGFRGVVRKPYVIDQMAEALALMVAAAGTRSSPLAKYDSRLLIEAVSR